MAGLLYFRRGLLSQPTLADVEALGLSHAFDHQPAKRDCTGPGPSGTPGVVFADARRMGDAPIGYYPKEQTWWAVPTLDGKETEIWIGWHKRMRPTPADLARVEQLPGLDVKLGDEQNWMVPTLQEWRGEGGGFCALPRPVTRDAAGKWGMGDVVPRYKQLWETGLKFWDVLIEGMKASTSDVFTYEFEGLHDFAVDLLAWNYAVSWMEISALELFLPHSAARVDEAAVDYPTFRDWLQKKSEGPATSDGDSSSDGAGE